MQAYASIYFNPYLSAPQELAVASLSVRRLDEETLSRLRIRAAKHGVSMEEEARRILKQAVSAPERLGDLAVRIFGPKHGIDLPMPERTPHEPLDLTG
jgi:plasmid stability protein